MKHAENLIVVGTFGAVYGIKGWLRINSFTDTMEDIFDYAPWTIQTAQGLKEVRVINSRPHSKGYIVQVEGINTPEEAQRWVNQEILIHGDQLETLTDNDFYWKDLIGCEVLNIQGYHMGVVSSLLETGSNDVLCVQANKKDAYGKIERLIPFIEDQFIVQIDLPAKKIHVNWQPDF
jgi:16S rRNA processing protein RimM